MHGKLRRTSRARRFSRNVLWLLFLSAVTACGSSGDGASNSETTATSTSTTPAAPPDTTAPAALTTFFATASTTGTTITLQWTAVGDDGNTGQATSYELRYLSGGACPINTGNFATGTLVTGMPTPANAGVTSETKVVTGLANNTTYCFGMQVSDEVPNTSAMALATGGANLTTLADSVAPSAVSDLAVSAATSTSITLTWTAVGDDANTGTAASYEMRYLPMVTSCALTMTAGTFSGGTLVASMPTPSVAGTANETKTVTGLTDSVTYCFAIKVNDEIPNTSGISNVITQAPYKSPTTVYGQSGNLSCSVRQNNGSCAIGTPTADNMYNPYGIAVDSSNNTYVADQNNHRVLYFAAGSQTATRVYGQGGSFTANTQNNGGISADSLYLPYGVAVDAGGVYIADYGNSRVLYYTGTSTTATRVYGQGGSFTTNTQNNGGITANSLYLPVGVSIDTASPGVYISDTYNNRVLYYSGTSTTATRVYGQAGSFTTGTVNNGGISANSLNNPNGVTAQGSTAVYVADYMNHRVLYYAGVSTTATRVYGQTLYTTNTANNGGFSATTLNNPSSIAINAAADVFIADYANNRVLYYATTSTTATRVYGQNGSFTVLNQNTGGLTKGLQNPFGVAYYAAGTALYVADVNNNRMLLY